MGDFFRDALIISRYSRAQGILDVVLIPITDIAKQHGFTLHTVITSNLAAEIDTESQLPVLLKSFHEKIKRQQESGEMMSTQTITTSGKVITVYLHIGGGDVGEPVLTLMLPKDL